MATMTIRNLPDDLHAALKERADKNRRSLNQQVIADLLESNGCSHEIMSEKVERVRQIVSLDQELRKGLTYPLTTEEIRAGINEGRK